ncbi:PepSY domain-containing protein [Streptomyces sp. CA-210063]|uniref:PepSY-associated TM helix domain-containing protein n=1 Tax=Streptomyces sp. CA-210063 TaxID=2801029 RepID=UPI00214C4B0E|nr:PepSY domain-containing protein [Streptomyces sp. CA-210063]UUU29016.1 PepSY domain-containing protein [Streptomyces sp. CA-210063]
MTTAPSTETDEPQKPVVKPDVTTRGWSSLRPLVLRLHFYAGVLVAPFLLVAALTGGLYAASFSVEKFVYADEMTVAKVGAEKLPISEQVAAAREAHPEGTISAVRPSPEDDATTRVMLTGVAGIDETNTLAVFVDPYTAQVRGALEQYGATGALPVRTWIDKFHANLQLGETGRLYSELAASWLWVISGGGLVLWFTRRRAQRKVRGTSGRRRTLGLHGTVGVWAAAGFFFLSATGLTWSTYAGANIEVLRTELHQATPAISAAAGDHGGHDAGPADGGTAADGDLDKILAAARAEGLGDPVEIVPPADASSTYVVKQVQRSWPTKQDAVAVDPATAEVTDTLRFADFPILAKLSRWGIDAHTGVLFGLVNQLLLIALALSLVMLILWGYRMWWQRGRASSFGRPIPRGAWQQVPPHLLVPALAVIAVLGYFVPLLGIPLAAFIVVDVVLGEIAYRRGKRSYGGRAEAKSDA